MKVRFGRSVILGAFTMLLAMGSGCGSTVTAPDPVAENATPSPEEHAKTIAALRPPKRARPLVAVLADNAGSETTDFLIPYGVLADSGLADVVAVAPDAGPIKLMPALTIRPQQTTASFDVQYPTGADYVIVPAMHRTDAPRVLEWIRSQSENGAIIVGICAGAKVLAAAGLLESRAATTHWYDIDALERQNPTLTRVDDRRYVVDRGVVTTTGVTASVPVALVLVEAIGGRAQAEAVAARLGAQDWSAHHQSASYRLEWTAVRLALGNLLAFWSHERIGVPVEAGVDEIALAFTSDAYSRTFRSKALTVATVDGILKTKRGIELVPDRTDASNDITHMLDPLPDDRPIRALDRTLEAIRCRYGERDAAFVALQVEYPWPGRGGPPSTDPAVAPDC
jgi:putative intracellular protease/amidase